MSITALDIEEDVHEKCLWLNYSVANMVKCDCKFMQIVLMRIDRNNYYASVHDAPLAYGSSFVCWSVSLSDLAYLAYLHEW